MEELMKVQVKNDRQLVSARDLHKGLGLKGRFSRWFKTNSELFTENEDFYKCTSSTVVNNGAVRELDNYLLTIEMAKQLAMMARTEKSKLYREYFLDLERKWNSPEMVMHRALEFSNARIEQLKLENKNLNIQLEESNKKASYLDLILGDPTPFLSLKLLMTMAIVLLLSTDCLKSLKSKDVSTVNGSYTEHLWVKAIQVLRARPTKIIMES